MATGKRGTGGTPQSRPVALAKKRRAAENKSTDKIALETILGITCYSGSSLAVSDACIAYPAGCVAVLFHPKGKGKQIHIHNRKPISCLCFSPNGTYLATGESGHEPCVRVWDLRSETISQVCRLKEHEYGVQCVAFSPSGKQLVSIGYQHDRQIIVWNWKAGTKLVHGKFANKVNAMAFSSNHSCKLGSSYFVTVHNRRVQFWYYSAPGREANTVMLKSRSAILGDLQQHNFVAVVCGRGSLTHCTYALTRTGQLCLFGANRALERFTETKTPLAYSLALNEQFLFCGCGDGVIRLFDPQSLDYITTMPHPHPLGINLASIDNTESDSEKQVHPDAIAIVVHQNRLSTVYNDHSVFVWDVTNIRQIGVLYSFLFHSAGVWDICTYPQLNVDSAQLLPPSCFITCSSDSTVRFWSLDADPEGAWSHRTVYSKELLRIIYCDPEDKLSLKDSSDLPGSASMGTRGVKCIQVRPDGQHIATGDRMGNLAVYDLQFLDLVYQEIAHDLEILTLSYSPPINNNQFLTSGSRDRMMHIFSLTDSSYEAIQTLSDHSAAVTAVRFVRGSEGNLHLLSSGADKSIIFHSMDQSQQEPVFNRSNNVVSKATIFDMDIDVLGKHVVTAGQDRVLRFYLINGGKQKSVIKASATESEGGLLKVSLDPSGLFAASSSADKSVLIFDVFSGECVAKLTGHSEVVTQVRFSQDCRFLYSVSGDSCIFVWRLSRKLTQAMHNRLAELGLPLPPGQKDMPTSPLLARETFTKFRTSTPQAPHIIPRDLEKSKDIESVDSVDHDADFEYRMSMLPGWAQREAGGDPIDPVMSRGTEGRERDQVVAPVEGRWAERVIGNELKLATQEPDSDADLEDLSAEMSKIVFEKQIVMEVIDLTQEDDMEAVSVSHVAMEGHVTEEANESKSSDSSDPEVKFFAVTEDVDPSIFFVTTPVKTSEEKDESEDDESLRESPSDSPVSLTKIVEEEEPSFLKAHFESLERTEDPLLLRVPSPRQSISAKFLEKSLRKTTSAVEQLDSVDKSSLLTTEAAGIVISVNQPQDDSVVTPLAMEEDVVQQDGGEVEGVVQDRETAKPMRRKLSFETDLARTKQKLKELGYSVKYDKQPTIAAAENPSEDQRQREDSSSDLPLKTEGKEAIVTEESSAKTPLEDISKLLARVSSITKALDANFRALVELHDQVLTADSQDSSSDDVVSSIATYLTTHKGNVVSMVNRNRQIWRERTRTKSLDNSSPELSVTIQSSSELSEEVQSEEKEMNISQSAYPEAVLSGSSDSLETRRPAPGEVTLRVSREELLRASVLANELNSLVNTMSTKVDKQSSLCDT